MQTEQRKAALLRDLQADLGTATSVNEIKVVVSKVIEMMLVDAELAMASFSDDVAAGAR